MKLTNSQHHVQTVNPFGNKPNVTYILTQCTKLEWDKLTTSTTLKQTLLHVDVTYIWLLCLWAMKNGQDNYEMTQGLITSTIRAMKAWDVLHHETQV